jgi:hypothetical protein
MIKFRKFTKAVVNAFSRLAIAAMVLVAETAFAETDSLESYHVSLVEKYGYQDFEVSVTRVTNPGRLKLMREMSENARHQLVDFASSIEAHAFTYHANKDFWRLNKGDRVLNYTFSIDILKNDVKLFDYYCFAILEDREDRGMIVDCSAHPAGS